MEEEKKSIVGDLINFRGMMYSPLNEMGVVFLFGKVVEDLNMYIEEIKPGYPDCIARRFVGKGWEEIAIEFELNAKNFLQHKHDPKQCDILVCWENDWPDCPKEYQIEIIELKSLIKELPNREVRKPTKGERTKDEEEKERIFLKFANDRAKDLFYKVNDILLALDERVWRNFGEKYTSYYSPERVFTYLRMQKTGIRVLIFNNGKKMESVRNQQPKWGIFRISNEKDLERAKKNWQKSLELIREALRNNENTGWYAKIEEDIEENDN
jgi:predicted transport protein